MFFLTAKTLRFSQGFYFFNFILRKSKFENRNLIYFVTDEFVLASAAFMVSNSD
jgi:hypothetical protein